MRLGPAYRIDGANLRPGTLKNEAREAMMTTYEIILTSLKPARWENSYPGMGTQAHIHLRTQIAFQIQRALSKIHLQQQGNPEFLRIIVDNRVIGTVQPKRAESAPA